MWDKFPTRYRRHLPKSFDDWSFKRIGDAFPTSSLWGNKGIDLSDVRQGGLGNCYFLAAIGAIAEFSETFKTMWITKEKNDAHAYGMNLYVRGKKIPIYVDDYIPTKGGRPTFS